MVNKADVQRKVVDDTMEPGKFKIAESEEDTAMLVNASLKEQMRNIDEIVPLHTADAVGC